MDKGRFVPDSIKSISDFSLDFGKHNYIDMEKTDTKTKNTTYYFNYRDVKVYKSETDLLLNQLKESIDLKKKVIILGECKGTRSTFEQTHDEYKWQLLHHYLLGCEKAKELGGYKVKVMLCHYCTDGIDLTQPFEFDTSRLTVKTLRNMEKLSKSYHLAEAMDIIDTFLENFTEFYEQDEVDANLLPANVQSQFLEVAQFLREIKEREDKVAAFKTKLYDFLSERVIRKVVCDDFSFTVVAPTQQISVDYKALFTQEIEVKKPRVAKRLKEKYKKTTNKKGYVFIHVNNDDKS